MKNIMHETISCACGCGETLNKYDDRGRPREFVYGHWPRVQPSQKVLVKCENCGREFPRHRYHMKIVRHHFCSKECEGAWSSKTGRRRGENNGHYNTIEVPCAGCGTPVRKAVSLIRRRNNRVYCPKCIPVKLRKGRKGFYVGYPKEFTPTLRNRIRRRDNFTCRICGRHQSEVGTLHVHHIDYIKTHNDPSNLAAVCVKCHGETNYGKEKWKAFFHSS